MKFFFKAIIINFLLLIMNFSFLNSQEYNQNNTIIYDEIYDPFEPLNRSILDFNFFVDDMVVSPVIKTYKSITPEPIQSGVNNFFNNLSEPIIGISFFLQGEFKKFFNSAGRFTINTITSLGTYDLASKVGMTKNETDIGLTLAKGGVSSGPYLVIPIVGPSNLRDISGGLVSYVIDPVSNNIPNRTYLSAISGLNSRAQIDEELNNLDDISIDRYELIKSVYYQNRNSQIEEDFVQNLPTPKIYID
tara:strand:+ start:519 stop:1259 length:741 start_codon:yes stop_codon:yes gene_type:complete